MQTILLFLILAALSPRLARGFLGKFFALLAALFIGCLILAAWPRLENASRTEPVATERHHTPLHGG